VLLHTLTPLNHIDLTAKGPHGVAEGELFDVRHSFNASTEFSNEVQHVLDVTVRRTIYFNVLF